MAPEASHWPQEAPNMPPKNPHIITEASNMAPEIPHMVSEPSKFEYRSKNSSYGTRSMWEGLFGLPIGLIALFNWRYGTIGGILWLISRGMLHNTWDS